MKTKLIVLMLVIVLLVMPFAFSAVGDNVEDHWYKFEDNLIDDGEDGDDLTDQGSVVYISGKVGNCVDFDGSTDYLTSTTWSTDQPTSFSVAGWYKQDAEVSNARAFEISDSIGSWMSKPAFMGPAPWGITPYVKDGASAPARVGFPAFDWVHLCLVAENGQPLKIYINGTLDGTAQPTITTLLDLNGNFAMGSEWGGAEKFNGCMDDFRYWHDYELTAEDCAKIYNNGDGTSISLVDIGVDTCTAPGSGDWNIDCSDNCVLDSAQDVVADMHLNGIGTIVLSSYLRFTGSNQILSIAGGCAIDNRPGGKIGGT